MVLLYQSTACTAGILPASGTEIPAGSRRYGLFKHALSCFIVSRYLKASNPHPEGWHGLALGKAVVAFRTIIIESSRSEDLGHPAGGLDRDFWEV